MPCQARSGHAVRVALDTNILAYAEGVNGASRRKIALEMIGKLPTEATLLPVQVLGELFHVLVRKAGRSPERARTAILSWQDTFSLIETSPAVLLAGLELAAKHRFGIWDATILAAAAAAGCRLLLSEDMQAGFTWSGVTVTNPFSSTHHELLAAWLGV
jgi:predicted nucleic acid-binding protein